MLRKTFLMAAPENKVFLEQISRNWPKITEHSTSEPGTKPPGDGKCRVCKRSIKVNSKRVCYECFVKQNLRDAGWTRNDVHPWWCECVLMVPHVDRNQTDRQSRNN